MKNEVKKLIKEEFQEKIKEIHESNIELLIFEWGSKDANIALTHACSRVICLYNLGLITEDECDDLMDMYADVMNSIVKPSCYCFRCTDVKEN